MKLTRIIPLLLLFTMVYTTVSSQRSRVRSRDDRRVEEQSVRQNLWYGISLGNFFISRDFSISGKFQGGYKVIDRVSIGAQAKIYYDFVNNAGPDISLLSYGAGPELRVKITNGVYAIGEYNLLSIEQIEGFGQGFQTSRSGLNFPTVGIGYQQGRGPWRFGAQLLFILSDEARDPSFLNRSVDYWIDFNYNF